MGDAITNFEVNSAQPKKAEQFYASVFGWKMQKAPGDYTFVDSGTGKGIGGGIGPLRGGKAFITVYVTVSDLDATLKKASGAGGKVVMGPTEVAPGTWIALFSDLDGNVVGINKGS